jgi:hypothetical protein
MGQRSTAVVKFPVKPKPRKASRAMTEILDLTGSRKAPFVGAARANTTQRAKTIGVSLPRMSWYEGDAYYLDGCLYVGDQIVRRRKI